MDIDPHVNDLICDHTQALDELFELEIVKKIMSGETPVLPQTGTINFFREDTTTAGLSIESRAGKSDDSCDDTLILNINETDNSLETQPMRLEKPVIQPAPNTKISSEPTPGTLNGIPDLYYLELREERLRQQKMRNKTQGDI